MKRIVTREDIEVARDAGRPLGVGPDDVVTEAARELAARWGVTIQVMGVDESAGAHRPTVGEVLAGSPPPERAVVSAVGRNRRGILAELTAQIAALGGSVEDISQRIVSGYFSAIFMVDLSEVDEFATLKHGLEALSVPGDYKVVVQHERIFQAMHRL
ncbi:MAG: ACT domain-containing protein [Planctomycetota bacterium]